MVEDSNHDKALAIAASVRLLRLSGVVELLKTTEFPGDTPPAERYKDPLTTRSTNEYADSQTGAAGIRRTRDARTFMRHVIRSEVFVEATAMPPSLKIIGNTETVFDMSSLVPPAPELLQQALDAAFTAPKRTEIAPRSYPLGGL